MTSGVTPLVDATNRVKPMTRISLVAAAGLMLAATNAIAGEPDPMTTAPVQPAQLAPETFDATLPSVDRLPAYHFQNIRNALAKRPAPRPLIAAAGVIDFPDNEALPRRHMMRLARTIHGDFKHVDRLW